MRTLTAYTAVLALVLAGCTTLREKEDAPYQADDSGDSQRSRETMMAVLWMQHAAEYQASARQTFRAATAQIDASLQPGSADLSQRALPQEKWMGKPTAIILDLDETLLDNSDYMAGLVKRRAIYNEITWDRWVQADSARDVPGAVEFVNAAKARIDKVFYVSNRVCRYPIDNVVDPNRIKDLCPQLLHTMKVMKGLGFPNSDDRSAFYLAGMYAILKSKKDIRENIGADNRIVMLVGDNLRDFVENRSDYQKDKKEMEELWGRRWFLLSNPAYGSWPDEFITESDRQKIKAACGDRPKGPDNWDKTQLWDDCSYPIQYRARTAALRTWNGH